MAKRSSNPKFLRSSYHHQALRQNRIRLLTTKCTHGTIEIEIDQYALTEDLEYDAISYVWGGAPASVTVKCNGKPLIVTPTALEMLHYLHRYQRSTAIRKFWIDAICINQEDPKEKSIQVPLMHNIYYRAAAVIVWMSPATPETDVFFAEFQEVREKSRPWIARYIADPDCRAPIKEELPCHAKAFWGGLGRLLDNEWFRRLWTYQEIILPKTATLLCGDSWVDFDGFVEFLIDGWYNTNLIINESGERDTRSISAARTCYAIQFYRNFNNRNERADGMKVRDVTTELYSLRPRHVREPVDRVWAIVGLLENDFRDKITSAVDYSAQGRNRYWKTWIMFAKALMDEPGGIELLQIPPTLESRLPYLPSWCPNLSGKSSCRRNLHGQWNLSVAKQLSTLRWALFEESSEEKSQERGRAIEQHDKISINTVGHDDMLRVRGFVVDTVEEVVNHENSLDIMEYDQLDPNSKENMTFHATAVDCHMESLDLARRVFYGKSEGVTDIPDDFIMAFVMDCRITEEAKNVYRETLPMFATWYSAQWEDPPKKHVHWSVLLTFMRGHSFFSTKGGRIGIAYPGCQPGDQIAAFYGGEVLYMIRQLGTTSHDNSVTGQASDHVQYCGAAFIPHLMEQHQRDTAHIGPDTTFFIH